MCQSSINKALRTLSTDSQAEAGKRKTMEIELETVYVTS